MRVRVRSRRPGAKRGESRRRRRSSCMNSAAFVPICMVMNLYCGRIYASSLFRFNLGVSSSDLAVISAGFA